MKTLKIKRVDFDASDIKEVSQHLDSLGEGTPIDIAAWESFPYKPNVKFNIAHTGNKILIKYYVHEKAIQALQVGNNAPVHLDSCVEFFVSPADDGIYYNFEFNGIGTCYIGSGTGRADSIPVDSLFNDTVLRYASLGSEPIEQKEGDFKWELTVAIPISVFFRHNVMDLGGKTFRANFYKCGDQLKDEHYTTWNRVGTENPDYHQPEFFGKINFE